MPFTLIKNNIKLMLRNKAILVVMAVLPIIIISLVSNIFEDLLSGAFSSEDFTCGYAVQKDSKYENIEKDLKDVVKDNGITLKEYNSDYRDYKEGMKNKEYTVFVNISDDTCTIYQDENKSIEAAVIEYIFSNYFEQYNNQVNIVKTMYEQGKTELKDYDNSVKTQSIDANPIPESDDYYGIVFVVFFSWCTPIVSAVVMASEKANRITKRFNISPMSNLKLFLGKIIPSILTGVILTLLSTSICTLVFKIQWGNYLETTLIMLLQIVACNALGLVVFYIFSNTAISIAALWTLFFFFGLVGGTFATYMYSGISEKILRFSPLYYENRTLIEFATKGISDYRNTCIIYLVIITVVSTLVGMLLMNKKMEACT